MRPRRSNTASRAVFSSLVPASRSLPCNSLNALCSESRPACTASKRYPRSLKYVFSNACCVHLSRQASIAIWGVSRSMSPIPALVVLKACWCFDLRPRGHPAKFTYPKSSCGLTGPPGYLPSMHFPAVIRRGKDAQKEAEWLGPHRTTNGGGGADSDRSDRFGPT